MRKRIDLKSLVLGMAAGVLLMLTVGAAITKPAIVSRYQITGTHSHALVIDTMTGQVWRGFFPPGSGNTDGDFLSPKAGVEGKN